MKDNIYVITHKSVKMPEIGGYIPLHVGSEGKSDLGYLKDNSGDNISLKNPYYCELTGLYWMWKNVDCDIIGLVHYRRYFFKHFFQNDLKNVLDVLDVEKIFNEYDIILPKKTYIFKYNVRERYEVAHNAHDLEIVKNVIKEKFPEYLDSFDKIMNSHYFYSYNMFIMRKDLMDEYCKWLFTILFESEKNIDVDSYNSYNKRVYGFLSERLFNVWLDYHKLKIKELWVNNTERNSIVDNGKYLIKKVIVR